MRRAGRVSTLVFPSPRSGEPCQEEEGASVPARCSLLSCLLHPPTPLSLCSFTFLMFFFFVVVVFFFSLPLSFPPVTPLPSSAGLPRCWAHQPAAGLSHSPPGLLLTFPCYIGIMLCRVGLPHIDAFVINISGSCVIFQKQRDVPASRWVGSGTSVLNRGGFPACCLVESITKR